MPQPSDPQILIYLPILTPPTPLIYPSTHLPTRTPTIHPPTHSSNHLLPHPSPLLTYLSTHPANYLPTHPSNTVPAYLPIAQVLWFHTKEHLKKLGHPWAWRGEGIKKFLFPLPMITELFLAPNPLRHPCPLIYRSFRTKGGKPGHFHCCPDWGNRIISQTEESEQPSWFDSSSNASTTASESNQRINDSQQICLIISSASLFVRWRISKSLLNSLVV